MDDKKATFFCRICGLDQEEYPWGEDNNSPTFGICACCGSEFGYHDFTLEGIRKHRKSWISSGAKWAEIKAMPSNWSLEKQLQNIPKEYLTKSKYICASDSLKLIIEEDVVGFYLIVFKDPKSDKSNEDYLVDSLEEAFQEAKDKFGISNEQWICIDA